MCKLLIKPGVVLVVLLLQLAASGQEVLFLENGEKPEISLVSVKGDAVYFRTPDPTDTTLFFVRKDQVKAIFFSKASVKDLGFKQSSFESVAKTNNPDYIYPVNNDPAKVMIDTVLQDEIHFRLAFAADTTLYSIKKSQLSYVTFREVSAKADEKGAEDYDLLDNYQLALKGSVDARQYYTEYKAAATVSFVAGLLTIYGLPFPIVASLMPPQPYALSGVDPKLMAKPAYQNAYRSTAHGIKAGKVWANYGYGVGTFFGSIIVIAFLIASTYRP